MPRLTNYISDHERSAKKPVRHAAAPVESPPVSQASTADEIIIKANEEEEQQSPQSTKTTPESSSSVGEEIKRLTALHQRRYVLLSSTRQRCSKEQNLAMQGLY